MCNPNFPGKSRYTVDDVIRMLDDSDISDLSDEEEQPFANDADGGSVESSSDDDTDTVLGDIPGDTLGEMVSVIMTQEAHRELQFCHNLFLKFLKSVYSDFLNVYKQHDCSSPTYQKQTKSCFKGVWGNNPNLVQIVPCAKYNQSWKFCKNLFILLHLSLPGQRGTVVVSICPPLCPSTPL